MNIKDQISEYIRSLTEQKHRELDTLHKMILNTKPDCKLWFLDGKNSENKIVSNPNIGYGHLTIKYKDGKTREFYQVGLSANTGGISVYIIGLTDKTFLTRTYSKKIGKATISGHCIKFKTLKDIHIEILEAAVRMGFAASGV